MKKISLIALIMLGMASIVAVHAADDLDDLDALLNDPALLDDTGSTTTGTADTTGNTVNIEEDTGDTQQDTATQVEKLTLTQTGDVTATSVTLQFQPLEEYTHYKIYYAPTGDENFEERDVTVDDTTQPAVVTIDGLNPNTEYQFVVKAFDNDGNPVEATTSDPITVKTAEQHAAPSDNVIYNPTIKVEGNKIIISWKAGADVDKVQISLSEDGKTFKPVATVDANEWTYTIEAQTTGKKYVKLVPIASDGTLGVCKVGAADVPYLTANVQPKQEAQKKIGHAKTGPETYVLLILAILGALAYTYRKRQA